MFLGDDDMIECPYNSTHRMLRKRLQSHLLKCRVHYKDVELRKCPFNITHLIPEPEFAHHATNCPDRKLITQYKYDAPEQKEEDIPKHAPVECDESWDDTEVIDYNPRLHLENAKVLLRPDGASRAERKLFIKKERKRLGDEVSSDDEVKSRASSKRKRKKHDSYADDYETRADRYDVPSYEQEMRARYKRSTSPSSSSLSSLGYRSPIGYPAHYPTYWRRSSREYTPPEFRPSSYTRNHSLPSYVPFDAAYEQYLRRGRRSPNNDQYNSGREDYYSYEANSETNYYMLPEAPPPPMISYPTLKPHSSKYPYPPY